MTAVEVLHHLQTRDIQLTVDGNQLRYDAPESAITEVVLTLLRQHKQALLLATMHSLLLTPTAVRRLLMLPLQNLQQLQQLL